MTDLFLKLLNMSLASCWVVLAVLLCRVLLQKAPRWIHCTLWGMVALRLVLPLALESPFSLIPSAQVIPEDILTTQTPAIHSGIPAINGAINPALTIYPDWLEQAVPIATAVWLTGMTMMLLYGVFAYWQLRRLVRGYVHKEKNVYLCDAVPTPFVLGVVRPKIFLPSYLSQEQEEYVLQHEKAHLRRLDHWWKPVGYVLLAVNWYNPLLWLAYCLLCRDIEKACDEKVVESMDNAQKKGYLETLVACSVYRRTVMICPVAFGEVGVKERVKSVLSYKKPTLWILLASLTVCAVTAVCFLTNPKPCEHNYESAITVQATCTETGIVTHSCSLCRDSYTTQAALLEHTYDRGVVTQAPTCTQEGVAEFTCTGCGAKKTATMEITAHIAGEIFLQKESNCTEQGENASECTACGQVFVVELLPTNELHDLTETEVRPATCTQEGEGLLSCSRCDHTESCTYEQLKHSWKNGTTHPATCATKGSQQQICTECGAERWLDIPKNDDHSWEYMGFYWPEQCGRCGKTKPTSRTNGNYSLLEENKTSEGEETIPVIHF